MPKKRKVTRKGAETLRVPSLSYDGYDLGGKRMGSLLVVQGADVDLGRHMLCDRPITIGRDDQTDLALSDGSISRQHCRVERQGETSVYVVVDLGSTNGTVLNGKAIDQQFPLSEGDKIFVGASVVRFAYSDAFDLKYHSRVEEMVSTDGLTGMASRRQYDYAFAAMAERAEAEQSLLSLMVMDMDGLKTINDTYGHQMGGFAIVEVSGVIRELLEPKGTVCRYGGDEFVCCFPGMPKADVMNLAEELRENVESRNIVRDGIRLEPTLSLGVATYPGDCERPQELFTQADRAMYRAKRNGRNQVAAADPTGPDPEGTLPS